MNENNIAIALVQELEKRISLLEKHLSSRISKIEVFLQYVFALAGMNNGSINYTDNEMKAVTEAIADQLMEWKAGMVG